MIRIRDPIHGSIRITPGELAVVDSYVYQRLRGVKQLGFADQAFPGATHTRYAHCLGAMALASEMFDAAFPREGVSWPDAERARLRQLVRLALLLHDVGHPPASHAGEACMPTRRALALDCFTADELEKRASHEDFALKLILDSELRPIIEQAFGDQGIAPEDIGHLITGRFPACTPRFRLGGVDYYPALHQMVSGEMDADRMDYLQRDSFYAGVSYGKFDQSWLLENLAHHVINGAAYLSLSHRAVFAFEDFLLSRYHMFVSVYYHYIPVGFETMLMRFFAEAPRDFVIPVDAEAFVATDDVALWSALRQSDNRWARRIVRRQAFRRLLELNTDEDAPDLDALCRTLEDKEIDFFVSRDIGMLSRYYQKGWADHPIFVVDRTRARVWRIDEYSKVYERYAQPTHLTRIYCLPEHAGAAQECLDLHLRNAAASE